MQERMEEDRTHFMGENARNEFSNRARELHEYRTLIEAQQKEFDSYRKQVQEEQLAREEELQRELRAREQMLAKREKHLASRQREFEFHLMQRGEEIEKLREKIAEQESRLQQAWIDVEYAKERYNEESRKKIELTSKDYVVDALDTLEKKELQFHRISKIWSAIGATSLVVSIGFFAYITLSSTVTLPNPLTWEFLAFSIFKGFLALALLAGLARYSFLFSSSYIQEALKNADRRHAINFGKFYLESYGAAAEWSQIKEAFEHWNITSSNAFKRADDSMPHISALERAVALVERANKAIPKLKKESGEAIIPFSLDNQK